jgi:hypothetical protein
LIGIHTGPLQLELPPNIPVFDSAGRYGTVYCGRNSLVEFVGIAYPAVECLLETAERIFFLGGRQTQPNSLAAPAGHFEDIVGRDLGPRSGRIHRLAISGDDVGVEPILDVGRSVGPAPETLGVVLIFGEKQLLGTIAMEPVLALLMVFGLNGAGPRFAQRRLAFVLTSGPGVAKP